MKHFSSFRKAFVRAAGLALVVLAGLGLRPQGARASHLRAGDIQAKLDTTANPNPRRVFFKMILYTDLVGDGTRPPATQPDATIFFGDGTSSGLDGVHRASAAALPIAGNTDTGLNIYYFEHTYPSIGTFTASFIGENRNNFVLNMYRAQDQAFYISTWFTLNPALGRNHSPVLKAPAIDKGAVGQVFLHNPAASDADGDSLSYKLLYCRQVRDGVVGTLAPRGNNQPLPVNCTDYRYPNDPVVTPGVRPVQVPYSGVPVGRVGQPAIFVQDADSGQITWNAPVRAGFYNVATKITEWRRNVGGTFDSIGSVVRDMQIIVSATDNVRPAITIPADLCVIAGARVTGTVTATDGFSAASPQTPVMLFAYSGIIPPATFVQTQTGPPVAQGTFTWQTDCRNVARLPYEVVFKAQDSPTGPPATNPPLIDLKTWRITVIGPPPQNLRAVPDASTGLNRGLLSWDPYACANAVRMHIYRKELPSRWSPSTCETGIPASAGYVEIDAVPIGTTAYIDNNRSAGGTNLGLGRGKTYCYRIYAEFPFPAGGKSIASAEACATFAGRAAQLTNVDVEATSPTAGRITVRWTQPRTAANGPFDAALAPAYVLSRGEGFSPTVFTPVRAPFTTLTDTSYVDTGLNTQDVAYTYKLEFTRRDAGGGSLPIVETSPTASSVRTTAVPTNPPTAMTVSWAYQVPWDNAARPAVVYRRDDRSGSAFAAIATVPTGASSGRYVDQDPALVRGQTYCYYVRTEGQYAPTGYLSSLLNKSQERCAALLAPPCTPVLALLPTNCDSLAALREFPTADQPYTNRLSWRLGSLPAGCDATGASYRVYYRPTPTGQLSLIGTTALTTFLHGPLAFSGGCYAVQAVAPSGAVSDTSNVACQENCLFFKLPNIFTPNGDGQNAVFKPKNNSPVRRIHFQAFNRWGVKVFENTTTAASRVLINWDGGGRTDESGASAKVADGIYFYLAEVEFADFANTKRTYKGWVEIVR